MSEPGVIWCRLNALGAIRVDGSDAHSFLQGQLSSDLQLLTSIPSQLASFNTATGRVIAVLRLIERPNGLLAVLPRALAMPVIERLRKYVLRAKVRLSDLSDEISVAGAVMSAEAPTEEHGLPWLETGMAGLSGEVNSVPLAGPVSRHLFYAPTGALLSLEGRLGLRDAGAQPWRAASIAAGEPQIYLETSELFVAQMLNLDLIDAVSFTKGCYTGQEIITRTQHLGRIKRRMLRYRVAGTRAIERGAAAQLEPGRRGRVIETAEISEGEQELLAVVPVAADAEVESSSAPILRATRLPLPYAIPGLEP